MRQDTNFSKPSTELMVPITRTPFYSVFGKGNRQDKYDLSYQIHGILIKQCNSGKYLNEMTQNLTYQVQFSIQKPCLQVVTITCLCVIVNELWTNANQLSGQNRAPSGRRFESEHAYVFLLPLRYLSKTVFALLFVCLSIIFLRPKSCRFD